MFVGRTAELQLLERAYAGADSSFLPIYGRRRVGKSELIYRFLEDKRGLYFLGKTAPAPLQVREFLREAARVVDEPLLALLPPDDWKQALLTTVERWTGPEKLVLVLDELQWIVAASPELPSVLQECWDRHWRDSGRVMLILCGSFVGFMEREVLGEKSPLFGRRTGQIHLRPFGFREAAAFHPTWSRADAAGAWFACGGVPLYHRFFDAHRSLEDNLATLFFDEHAPLAREPDFLLREELREVEKYYAILLAIAGGHTTNRTIAEHTGVPERSLHYYITQLGGLGYVGRRHPLTGRPPVARHVRYALDDALLRFWFRFVFPNLSFIRQMGPQRSFRERVRPDLPSWFGLCFERLCREALPRLYEREGVGAAFQVGEYWDKSVQIDVVGLRDDGWTDIGECKWGTVRSRPALEAELAAKVGAYPNPRGATLGRRAFLRCRPAGTPREANGVRWHDLDDLYE